MRIEIPTEEGAKERMALKAAISSNSLMCLSSSTAVHGPLAVTLLQVAPQPEREESEKITKSGSIGENVFEL